MIIGMVHEVWVVSFKYLYGKSFEFVTLDGTNYLVHVPCWIKLLAEVLVLYFIDNTSNTIGCILSKRGLW